MISVTVILFLIMDPIGNASIVLRLLNGVQADRQIRVIGREMLIALATMLFFYLIGDLLLGILNISETTVRLSSGIVLFIAAIKIIFPNMGSIRDVVSSDQEPFIVPIAIPLVSGPSLLATIMLFTRLSSLDAVLLPAILVSWLFATVLMLFSRRLHSLLGENGLTACERVMGMILVLLAIQRFLEGLRLFIDTI